MDVYTLSGQREGRPHREQPRSCHDASVSRWPDLADEQVQRPFAHLENRKTKNTVDHLNWITL